MHDLWFYLSLARYCSDSQGSFNVQERSKDQEDGKDDEENDDIHLMLFVGYNEARKNNKPTSLN